MVVLVISLLAEDVKMKIRKSRGGGGRTAATYMDKKKTGHGRYDILALRELGGGVWWQREKAGAKIAVSR